MTQESTRPPYRKTPITKSTFVDLSGITVGELEVLYPIDRPQHVSETNNSVYWWVKCSCGEEFAAASRTLRRRKRSDHEDFGATACRKCAHLLRIAKFRTPHGQSRARINNIWRQLKDRCRNKKNSKYPRYGGRGISYCKEWEGFIPFYVWAMENGYEDHLTIERKDVNGNYCPENCCWIPRKEQDWNKGNSRYITINGEEMTFTKFYYQKNRPIKYSIAYQRFINGWKLSEIFSVPYNTRRNKKR